MFGSHQRARLQGATDKESTFASELLLGAGEIKVELTTCRPERVFEPERSRAARLTVLKLSCCRSEPRPSAYILYTRIARAEAFVKGIVHFFAPAGD